MAQTKIKATAQLFLDTSNAEGDAKKFVEDLKKKLVSIETAADKMTVFKDMVGYIGQVDQALSDLQANNKDVFDHMFDGIGADLKKAMESIFGATSENMSALQQLKAKVAAAKADSTTTGDDLKPLEKEVRDLYKSLGMSGKSGIYGKGKVETRLANLEAALTNFGVVFENVQSKIKGGFKLGETGIGGSTDAIQGEIDKLQKQVDQYKALQKQLQHLADENAKFAKNEALSDEFTVAAKTGNDILDLIKLWEKLNKERQKMINGGDTSSVDYHENLSKMTETALKLQKLQADLSQKTQDKLHTIRVGKSNLGEMFENAYLSADDFLTDATDELNNIPKTIGKIVSETESKMADLQNALKPVSAQGAGGVGDVVAQNNKAIDSYNKLAAKVKEYANLQKRLQSNEVIPDEEENKMNDRVAELDEYFDSLGKNKDEVSKIQQIFVDLTDGAIDAEKAMQQLGTILKFDMSSGVSGIQEVGQHVVDATEYVRGMTLALKEMFDVLSKASNAEYKALIGGQDIAIKMGQNKEVSGKVTAEAYLANIMKDIDVDAHSHQGMIANIDAPDFLQAIRRQYSGLAKLSAVIGDKDIVTLDLAKVKAEDAYAALKKLQELTTKKGKASLSVEEFNKILTDINPEYTDVAQRWSPEQFGNLAEKIFNIKQSFQQALDPAQKLKNVLTAIAGRDIDFSKYDTLFKSLTKDNVADIFNQIAKAENIKEDGKILQADDITTGTVKSVLDNIQKQKDAYADLRQNAKLTYQEIADAMTDFANNYHKKNDQDFEFLSKYFHPEEIQNIRNMVMDVGDGFRDLNGVIKQVSTEFGIDPDEIEQLTALNEANQKLQTSIGKSVSNTESDDLDEQAEQLKKENGLLEEKLELLTEIANQYGMSITKKDRDRLEALVDKEMDVGLSEKEEDRQFELAAKIEEADSAMQEFGETYEKIILKLANGKNVEILPDDKGLRALDKIANEYYDGEYNGQEIQDVLFVRKQEQEVIAQTNQQLQNQLQIQQQIEGEAKKAAEVVKHFNDVVDEIQAGSIDSSDSANYYDGQLDAIYDQIEALHELGVVSDDVMKEVESNYEDAQEYIEFANRNQNILNELSSLNNKATLTEDVAELESIIEERKKLIDFAEEKEYLNDDELEAERAITAEIEKQLQAKKQIAQVTQAYDDVFDVLHNIGNQWKDLDTVDSAVGFMSLSDIDQYAQKLEGLVKVIDSIDPTFQHGDKTEYDGAVKTLEKLKVLSERTKLTDEFKNTINQFEQLGKFQWSNELTDGYLNILKDIRKGTYETIGQCVAKFNELSTAANKPTMDVATAFRELVKHISSSHSSPSTIFDHLEGTTLKVGDNLKEILEALNLIDSKGKVNLTSLKTGFTNKGGFVSDQYTMIARPDYYLGKIQSIQPKLQQAQKEGAQIGAIFDIIEDKAKGLIYEIQNTVPGESVLGHHSGKTNKDVLNASTAHIEGLVNTLQILAKNGLFVDWGGDNVLYDPQKGFSIIDMGDKGGKHFTVSAQNTLQENLDRMVQEMFKYSSLDMQQALKDGMVKNLYASAQKLDSAVVNPYAPKQQKAAQAASTQVAAAVKSESDVHDKNTASINAENAALQAQIELKKQAQSMKWEAFATDDSLSALKQAAGMQTLGQLEGFWKQANYEKQIDFHEITDTEAKQIFKNKLPKGLASAWYGSADFMAKSKLENEILADDEIRNAAMSYFWHIFKNSYSSKKYPNVKTFEDFLDTEMTMYRGDQSPLIYDPSSKLSFSINESTANGFNANLGTIKIKPKDTIGNAGSTFTSELETFVPSEQTSWFKKTREAFEDFYNNQTKEMQKEIDAGLVNFEKKRVSDILGDDLSTLTHKALQSSYWKHNVADDLKNGVIPEQITVPTDGSDYAQFADAYNGLNDSMKRFVMFFASMDQLSASLPKPLSISTQTAGGGFKYGKNAVGADAKLFNAILNDPEGRHQHLAKLTGEQTFNLMGQAPDAINAEADAHERNAQAVAAEAQAKKDLSSLQERYDHVMDDLWDSSVDADGSKHKDLSKLWSQLYDVQHSEQDLVDQGMYAQKSTGDDVQATDLFQLVVDIEQKYNENLDYVKDYLKQVYSNIDFGNITPALMSPTQADFDATKTKTYETAKNAYKSGNQREYFKILSVLNHLNDVEAADAEDIAKAQYTDTDTGRRYDVSKLIGMVKSIEDAYGENFDYVYAYLKKVYGDATIDDALSNLSNDDAGARRDTGSQYTVEDYEKIYAAAPVDMQAAIDDLAVFQQRYEQLYALTNTQPIEIMFPGKPTLNEVDQVIAAFEEFKSKQRQIFQLQMLDYEGNKDKIQELQAEAVGLQNKLHDAALGEDADLSEYKLTYGFMDDQDADRFKNLVEMTESVHTVMNDLTRIGEHKMSLIPPEMQDMLEYESGDTAERFMALHAQQVQSAKAAAQQADASAAASKQQLQSEQDITAEKQKQATLENQREAQDTPDVTKAQVAQDEAAAMGALLQKVEAVKAAVIAKTDAFTAEGQAVQQIAQQEIAALTPLKTLLADIQNSLQLIFAANNWNIGDVNLSQDKTSSNSMSNIFGEIKSVLGQIYGVLSKSTGVESDNKNSAKVKEPVVDSNVTDSDGYKLLAAKLPQDVATESTLSAILAAVNQLAKAPKDSENEDLTNISAALVAAAAELKNAANGIIEQKKKAQSDTSVAQARISDKDSYVQIKSAALGSLGDRALDSEVTEMQALANGVVKVTGWLKVAEDAWEGFTVKVNEANVASGLAIEQNTKAAKQAAAQAKKLKETRDEEDVDLNIKQYSPEETKARAQEKIAKYTSEGKIATVQFKDSGRYTITILEKIGGLTKQIFQTFDENDAMIERTTATMSNAALAKIQDLQKIAQYGFDNNLIGDGDQLYQDFQRASQELEAMNFMYSQAGQLSNDQIANWKLQIDLVTQLGKQVQKLVSQNKNPAINTKVNKKAYGTTPVINAQAKFNTLESRAQQYVDSGWSDISDAYQKYAAALKNLIGLQNQFNNGQDPTDAQKTQFVQLKDACSAASKELKNLLDMADKFNSESHEVQDISDDVNVDDRNSRADALRAYVQEVYGAQAAIGKFNGDMTELQFTIKNADGTITNMAAAFNSAKTQIGSLHGETKKATTIFDELGGKFKELWRYAAARMGVDEVIQAVRKGVEYVREIDAALTDLKKVTNETDTTYNQFLQTMSKTAGNIGSTVADLTTMAAEWARLGYSLEESGMLAESTAILLNVSEFDDATAASEALISTMQAFGYAADESQHVVDILNEVKVTCLLIQ